MKPNAFLVVAFIYCCVAVLLAIFITFENISTVTWRIAAVVIVVISVRCRDVVTTIFLGSSSSANWFVFIPLTLFLVIVFGSLYTAEQR